MADLDYERPTDPCILSKYVPNSDGYAVITFHSAGRRFSVPQHRVAYAKANNLLMQDIKDKIVMHKCDVRNCINPNHLILGTVANNNEDKLRKGRNIGFAVGNKYQKLGTGNTRLTDEQVKEIRTMSGRQVDIARKFGITQAQVSNIVSGKQRK